MDQDVRRKLIGPSSGQEFELTGSDVVIGRAPSVDFVIAQSSVSGRHALISTQMGQVTIEDLNSTNGTFLNGRRVMGRQTLNDGDEIRLGQSVILKYSAPSPAVDATMLQGPPVDATIMEEDLSALRDQEIASPDSTQVSDGIRPPEDKPQAAPPPPPHLRLCRPHLRLCRPHLRLCRPSPHLPAPVRR